MVVEVVGSKVEERAVGDSEGSWAAGAGVGCWVLPVIRTGVRVRAPGVCAGFPWCPACVPVLVHVYVAMSLRCLSCAGKWVIRGGSTSAPGCVSAFAAGPSGHTSEREPNGPGHRTHVHTQGAEGKNQHPMGPTHWGDPADPPGQQQGRYPRATGPSPARLHQGP